jgi:hypothetical protein
MSLKLICYLFSPAKEENWTIMVKTRKPQVPGSNAQSEKCLDGTN